MDAQKKSLGASERNEEERSAWRDEVKDIDPKRFVFVDECGTNIALRRLYARAPRGERAFGKVPRNWGKNLRLIAAMSAEEGMGQAMSVEGATDGAAFEAYVKHFLLPTLKDGQVVVMDNLQVHKSTKVRKLVEGAGARVLLLTTILTGFLTDRRGFLEDQGHLTPGRGSHAGDFGRSDRAGARCGQP